MLRLHGQQSRLYGAVDPYTNEVLRVSLYPTATKQTTRWLLTELHQRYQLDDAGFSSITQTILVAFSLKMAIDSKRSRSGATAGRRGAEKGIGLGKGGQPQLRSAVTVSSGAFNPVLYQIHVMAFEDLLNDPVIQKYLHELVGPTGMPVAAAPPDGEVTDEELAEELGLELNDVRRALFILYENDLATYRRVRDEDSGWLTYLWTFHYDNIPENLEEEMYRLLDALEEREEYERTHEFYLCEVCSIRFEFGEAMDFGFECPECGSPVEAMDNDRLREAMGQRVEAP